MKIVFIGAGNLAVHLSKALQNAGFEITQVYSRTKTSAKELATKLHVPYTSEISRIDATASLYLISVKDDAIESVIKKLPSTDGLVVHTAGSVPLNIFAGKFANYGVLYPLQTFSKSRFVDFSEIPVFLEANTQDNLQILYKVSEAISHRVYEASSAERMKLHLAAVFGCNFVNLLLHFSAEIAKKAGFDFSVLSPLILETVHKAINSGNPKEVQTGPAIRNDQNLMRKHIDLLESQPRFQEIYALLSENIRKQTCWV